MDEFEIILKAEILRKYLQEWMGENYFRSHRIMEWEVTRGIKIAK